MKEIHGCVPKDCYIGTFDENKWFQYIGIPLVIVKQPVVEMGFIAVELLVNRISKRTSIIKKTSRQKNIVLDFEIIEM